jgi:hypothetical protein
MVRDFDGVERLAGGGRVARGRVDALRLERHFLTAGDRTDAQIEVEPFAQPVRCARDLVEQRLRPTLPSTPVIAR